MQCRGFFRGPVIFCNKKTWSWPCSTLSPTAVGYSPTAVGYPPTAVGYCPTAVAYCPTAVGYPPSAVSYPPAAVGCTPTAVGYLPTAVGYPPTAVSCTPTAVGYPLSAIGWSCADFADHRTHQLFFFFIKNPLVQCRLVECNTSAIHPTWCVMQRLFVVFRSSSCSPKSSRRCRSSSIGPCPGPRG